MVDFPILSTFVNEVKDKYSQNDIDNFPQIIQDIIRVRERLLNPKFMPSVQLKNEIQRHMRSARYPLEVAVVGQFSSGKSTFLNALISKNILPTGITPVTSKVNYINYGSEYKLKITFKSGAEEFAPLETIEEFTDQRKHELKSVKYLTIYAPIEMLKDITFVDTPGLNSLSDDDTSVTKKVLKDVGGIIWLTLIDNAGKQSEEEVLKEYMQQFKNKSLCVLNQKDRFDENQIEATTNYVKNSFSDYFADVIPISAKLALESREQHKMTLVKDEYLGLSKEIKSIILQEGLEDTSKITQLLNTAQSRVSDINSSDSTNNKKLYQESNIGDVIDFIENKIRPMAKESKEFGIKNKLKEICDTLINEYHSIVRIYHELIKILSDNEPKAISRMDDIQKNYEAELLDIYELIEGVVNTISNEIYNNIKQVKKEKIEEKKGFLNTKVQKQTYEISWIDSDMIYKNLFYDDDKIEKMFKIVKKNLHIIEESISDDLQNIYNRLQNDVKMWQEPFELIRKHKEIASDLEFSTTRHFAAKVHENVLDHFKHLIQSNILDINNNFSYFNGALSYSYIAITKATIAYFKRRIRQADELYIIDSTATNQYKPTIDEIREKLKSDFKYAKVNEFLTSKQNFLYKSTLTLKKHYKANNTDRIHFINEKKNRYLEKISELEEIKNSI
jgi:GTPase SAR1 family protein